MWINLHQRPNCIFDHLMIVIRKSVNQGIYSL